MRLALIADTFPPLRNSGAVQLRDLAREFARQGHDLTVLLPAADLEAPWHLEPVDSAKLLRLKAPRTKDIGYVQRTLAELAMPFAMRRNLAKSPLANQSYEGVIWYSPSIFHGPLVRHLKTRNRCPSYLIIRDIFPEWAVDMGLMGRGLPYRFFDAVARYQYGVADVIGVQTPGNKSYFSNWAAKPGRRLEVLQNWLDQPADTPCPIRLADTKLAGRKCFVYAGNMGVAQGLDRIMELVAHFAPKTDVGFVFVGRGSEAQRLRRMAEDKALPNILFYDEIHPDEIPNLYAQCDIGLVALDPRHKSHNIPGKFLTYMQSGLPALANVNAGNDLVAMIHEEQVGQSCDDDNLASLITAAETLLAQIDKGHPFKARCKALFAERFSVSHTVRQIITALNTSA